MSPSSDLGAAETSCSLTAFEWRHVLHHVSPRIEVPNAEHIGERHGTWDSAYEPILQDTLYRNNFLTRQESCRCDPRLQIK